MSNRLDASRYDDKFYKAPKVVISLYGCLDGFTASAKLVYMALLDRATPNPDRKCWPTLYDLEFELGMSAKTISRAIDVLVKYDLVKITKRGAGKNYAYIVRDPLTVAEFAAKWPKAFRQWERMRNEIEARRESDAERLKEARDKFTE